MPFRSECMKKILVINTVGFQYEGITSVVLNYIGEMHRDGLNYTFPVYADIHPRLKEELNALGSTITVPDRKRDVKGYIAQLYRILGEGYDVLHVHGNSGTMLIETALAKLRGVKKVIVHAHSTSTNHPLANAVMKYPMMFMADERLACSKAAGEWLYGKRTYMVLNNAIDIGKYRFDAQNRKHYREEFDIKDEEFLIGHIGHFTPQKNHFFLLDVFKAYHSLNPNTKLLLIGDGPDQPRVKEMAKDLGIWNQVIFAGRRSDAACIYSAMDLFLLPSRREGLPLVMVEAQANGLPMLVSDVITKDACCTDRVFRRPLSAGSDAWAKEIGEIAGMPCARADDLTSLIRACGFDIYKEAETLRNIYIS